jgi:LemA protein
MPTSWFTLIIAAILLFWAVGARNRLVRMRNDITVCFGVVQTQLQQRHTLLGQWVESLGSVLGEHASELISVKAACQQVQVASEHLLAKPVAAQPAASLRMAEETLTAARARLTTALPSWAAAAQTPQTLTTSDPTSADNTLGFARREFNRATQSYNDALLEFPTWIVAGLFGFRAAGTL